MSSGREQQKISRQRSQATLGDKIPKEAIAVSYSLEIANAMFNMAQD
jgi:hypothetical protein